MYKHIGFFILSFICHVNLGNTLEVRVLPGFQSFNRHNVRSGNITILDEKTFEISNLYYDGQGPAAYFWVGTGKKPGSVGFKVPDDTGSTEKLKKYEGKNTIKITLPGALTVHDIDWLSIWCKEAKQYFSFISIPKDLKVPRAENAVTTSLNCHKFSKTSLKVEWDIKNDLVEVVLTAKLQENQYMAFGWSDTSITNLVGADLTVVFYDKNSKTYTAVDYIVLSTAEECHGSKGICVDTAVGGKNDVIVLSTSTINGMVKFKYSKPLQTTEASDKQFPKTGKVDVVTAVGPLNDKQEAQPTNNTETFSFENPLGYNCSITPWVPKTLKNETEFKVRIGPNGGKKGFSAITGIPSYGTNALYINNLLIPEITVEKGKTYKFTIESGKSCEFYITDSTECGYDYDPKCKENGQKLNTSATVKGKSCEWKEDGSDKWLDSDTFENYKKTFKEECTDEDLHTLTWTVPNNAPKLLYYQCANQINLGWKINVNAAVTNPPSIFIVVMIMFTIFAKIL